MNWDISQFHFLRPWCLLIIPLVCLLWWLMSKSLKPTAWENYISQPLLAALRVGPTQQTAKARLGLLIAWLIASFALAGPTWQKISVPTIQNQDALVIALDLSRSMLAQDLTPNRLTQARYKIIDILRHKQDGQIALIAYAGDAHTVSPLTDDPRSIEALLPALSPNIMPSHGSNTESAINLASQLLNDSGVSSGTILLITDGVAAEAQNTIRKTLSSNFELSILGIGSTSPTPIPLQDGGFLRNQSNEIVLSTLNSSELKSLANNQGGRYTQWQTSGADIEYLLTDHVSTGLEQSNNSNNTLYDSWQDMGPWLALLLLPIIAWSFRKGLVYCLLFSSTAALFMPDTSYAFSWDDLWQTKDQQAAKLLKENKPEEAANTFQNPHWQGVANYQAGDYASAANSFASDDVTSAYNRGNALAMQGELEAAIKAYDLALSKQPDHEDATYNKQVIEQLLKQQEQSDSNQQSSDSKDGENNQQDGENSDQANQSSSGNDDAQNSNDSSMQDNNSEAENADNEDQEEPSNADEQNSTESNTGSEQANQQEQSASSEEQSTPATPSENDDSEQAESEVAPEQQDKTQNSDEESDTTNTYVQAEPTPDNLKESSEQWLRRIQEDPSGLLRRKFEYQTRQRAEERYANPNTDNNTQSERY